VLPTTSDDPDGLYGLNGLDDLAGFDHLYETTCTN
jgi:hypothetical protein